MSVAFDDVRVLDLSKRMSGAYASRLFGDFGAEVIMVEDSKGHTLRNQEVLHSYINWNKKSVLCEDESEIVKLIKSSDVVVTDDVDPSSVLYRLVRVNKSKSTVHLSVTPHGMDGNLVGVRGNNLTACARTGFSYINILEDEPPLQLPNTLTSYAAGVSGFITAAAVLHRVRLNGIGDLIDLSEVEALAVMNHPWSIQAIFDDRGDSRGVLGAPPRGVPRPLWQARDGLINFGLGDFRNWTESMKVMGLDDFAYDEDLIVDLGRHGNPKVADVAAAAAGAILDKDRAELFHGLAELRSICGMVRDMSDVYNCEHLEDRGYFVETELKGVKIKFPGPPAKLSSLEWSLHNKAPYMAEHAETIDMDRPIKIRPLKENGEVSSDGPLSGIKVLTFAHAWSGPFATELLGFLGAEVVQIEAPHRPDVWRRSGKREIMKGVRNDSIPQHPLNTQGLYNSANLNKRAITLNMATEEGQKIFWDLVPEFDVVVDNFTPKVMAKWGVTQENLEKKKPGMIYASLSAFGATGPYQEYPGNGGTTEPMSGLSSVHGYEGDQGMNTGGMIPDPVSGYFIVSCILAAINNRDRTGQGQRIEGSMIEAMTMVVGDALGDYQTTGTIPGPTGNKHPIYAPHNVYMAEDGEWVALAIDTDESWDKFSRLTDLSEDDRFKDNAGRKNNEDALDELVAAWVASHTADIVETMVSDINGCAAKVLSPYEMYTKGEENFQSRGFVSNISHPETGVSLLPTRWWKFGSGKSTEVTHAPCFGEHSQEVLKEYLGIDGEEYQSLVEKLVTGTIYDYERYK